MVFGALNGFITHNQNIFCVFFWSLFHSFNRPIILRIYICRCTPITHYRKKTILCWKHMVCRFNSSKSKIILWWKKTMLCNLRKKIVLFTHTIFTEQTILLLPVTFRFYKHIQIDSTTKNELKTLDRWNDQQWPSKHMPFNNGTFFLVEPISSFFFFFLLRSAQCAGNL